MTTFYVWGKAGRPLGLTRMPERPFWLRDEQLLCAIEVAEAAEAVEFFDQWVELDLNGHAR